MLDLVTPGRARRPPPIGPKRAGMGTPPSPGPWTLSLGWARRSPKFGPTGPESGPRARERPIIAEDESTDLPPDRQVEVGDLFVHPWVRQNKLVLFQTKTSVTFLLS